MVLINVMLVDMQSGNAICLKSWNNKFPFFHSIPGVVVFWVNKQRWFWWYKRCQTRPLIAFWRLQFRLTCRLVVLQGTGRGFGGERFPSKIVSNCLTVEGIVSEKLCIG